MTTKILLKGGHVLTMDPAVGPMPQTDILIADGTITGLGQNLDTADCLTVDAANAIVMPGLVDAHRHLWQTTLRALLADWTLHEYMRGIRFSVAPVLTPEDVFIATRLGALEAMNAGVTTLFDYSHNILSPEHADAAVEALASSKMRAVFGYGFVPAPSDSPAFTSLEERVADAGRVRTRYLSDDEALVTMGISLTEVGLIPFSETIREIAAARDLGCRVHSLHDGMYRGSTIGHGLQRLANAHLLGEEMLVVHANGASSDDLRLLAQFGCSIAHTPDSELQMGMGHPIFAKARMNGVTSSVGCDIVSSNGGDLLGQVRLGLQDARAQANDEWIAAGGMARTLEITAADALGWATTGGAKALGLENKIGVIGPGKKADLIVVRPGEPNLWPLPASEGGVALHVHPADISDVMINGVFVKTDGRLADVDYEKEFAIAQRSRADFMSRVLARSGVLLPPEDATSLASLEETAIANLAS